MAKQIIRYVSEIDDHMVFTTEAAANEYDECERLKQTVSKVLVETVDSYDFEWDSAMVETVTEMLVITDLLARLNLAVGLAVGNNL